MSAFLVLPACWVLGRVAVGDIVKAQCRWIGGWQGVAGGACRRWGRVTDQDSGEGVDRLVKKRGKSGFPCSAGHLDHGGRRGTSTTIVLRP